MALPPIQNVPPLDWQTPIVDPKTGNPSAQFIRLWQTMFGNADNTQGDVTGLQSQIDALDTAVGGKADKTTTITAGIGLAGGGSLAANRTIDLEDTAVTPGSYTNTDLTVDAQGRITAASNGSGGGGGGSYALIDQVVTSSSQASVSFSSLPTGYTDLVLRITAKSDTTSGLDTAITVQFNGDTAGNYDTQQGFTVGSGGANVQSLNQTSFKGLQVATSNGGVNAATFDHGTIDIGNYNSTVAHKSMVGHCSNTDTTLRHLRFSGRWKNTAAITDILVALASGNFVDGSIVSLYGVE